MLTVSDPGVRGGAAGAGGPVNGLTNDQFAFWLAGLDLFKIKVSVKGTEPNAPVLGLGPTFNGNNCAMCHAQPAEGGTAPSPISPQVPQNNPQTLVFNEFGASNTLPSFITVNGPVREARFIKDPASGKLDGGVHDLFTIQGRQDAPGCTLAQPDFPTQLANHNVIFRIPTPLFGVGFVENTPDLTLQNNLSANGLIKGKLGISGHFNLSGNDGSIAKFGWKAQNKSLLIFAGEASNVEQGITNENFTNERSGVPGCVFNKTPEDITPHAPVAGFTPNPPSPVSDNSSLISNFAAFMRLNDVPTPAPATNPALLASQQRGQALFTKNPTLDTTGAATDAETSFTAGGGIGCALCHSASLTSAASPFGGMSNVTYQPFSDFAVHNMGALLSDGVTQGGAGPREFRSAPLWGVGQRIFFLHDGRTADLLVAIRDHASLGSSCFNSDSAAASSANTAENGFSSSASSPDAISSGPTPLSPSGISEATLVINRFNCLSPGHQQDVLNFLRSL